MKYKIRKATRQELDMAVEWAAKEGWNPGLHDADVFWSTDPNGFVVLEKDSEMIGSGSIVSYGGKFGFMGFFIVKPEFRSKGLGTKLWFWRRDKLLSRLNKGASIGMDGVFAMQPFYAKGGFKFSHRDLRMEGVAIKENFDKNISIVLPSDLKKLNEFDKEFFGFAREKFIKGWVNMPQSKAYKYLDGSKIKGYGVIRKCRQGYKIGPLFANSYKISEELFKALCNFAVGKTIYLDIPEINKDALKLTKKYKMKECFGCARMYLGKAPKLPYKKIFGVTTFELG